MNSTSRPFRRIVIYPKDIIILTGRKESYTRGIIRAMKNHYGKAPEQLLTVKEMCAYLGLDMEEVINVLRL